MNIQNQINLIISYMNRNTYEGIGIVEINEKCGIVYVHALKTPSVYYTIYSIYSNEEIEGFELLQMENLIEDKISEDEMCAAEI